MSELVKGDEVQLKSGGPKMVISELGDFSPMGPGKAHDAFGSTSPRRWRTCSISLSSRNILIPESAPFLCVEAKQ